MWPLLLSLVILSDVDSFSITPPSGRCLSRGDEVYNKFNTLSAYHAVRGNIPTIKGCKPEGIWAFVRHGTRFPTEKQFGKFKNLSSMIAGKYDDMKGMCRGDIDNLRNWDLAVKDHQLMMLTHSGIEELRQLGERLKRNFPSLLDKFSPMDVKVRVTSKPRTHQTAEALAFGMYKTHLKVTDSKIYDDLIRNEVTCKSWEPSTESATFEEENVKFHNSTEVKRLISSVSKRLGFNESLTFDVINAIYSLCSYEYSWYHKGQSSPWCSAFTDEELQILEYYKDLKYYYKSAYGNKYTIKLGCEFIRDMLDKLTKLQKKVTFYFGHSSTNRKLLVALGIGNSAPLKGDGFGRSANRQWRTSLFIPFSANVVAVRYNCMRPAPGINERTRLAFFVNEKLTPIRACGNRQMCGLNEFRQRFASIIDPKFCNREFCKLK